MDAMSGRIVEGLGGKAISSKGMPSMEVGLVVLGGLLMRMSSFHMSVWEVDT